MKMPAKYIAKLIIYGNHELLDIRAALKGVAMISGTKTAAESCENAVVLDMY
jgi:hypothetical protein